MIKIKKIEQFVKDYCQQYYLDYDSFFSYFNHEKFEYVDCEVKNPKNYRTLYLKHAEMVLGMDAEDILFQNVSAKNKWEEEFPYFRHQRGLDDIYNASFKHGGQGRKLLEAIFGSKFVPDGSEPSLKYNYSDICNRLVAQLKEINEYLPGTFHPNDELEVVQIQTTSLCSYPFGIEELVDNYIEMIHSYGKLFFQALKSELSKEECLKFNFLVSYFGIRDLHRNQLLYYANFKLLKHTYQEKESTDIFDYVKMQFPDKCQPWKCIEFIIDSKLVQRYLDAVPGVKNRMRNFSELVSKIFCSYRWVDNKNIANQSSVPLTIYLKKTKRELVGIEKYAEQLEELCSSSKLGGVKGRNGKDIMKQIAETQKYFEKYGSVQLIESNFYDSYYKELGVVPPFETLNVDAYMEDMFEEGF